MINPSRYQLPQFVSEDRKRARRATIALNQESYLFASDSGSGHPSTEFHLPPGIAGLPKVEDFDGEKKVRLLLHKTFSQLQAPFVRMAMSGSPMDNQVDYERVVGWLPRPREADSWYRDEDFGRQRLRGVNPKALFRLEAVPDLPLADASARVLAERFSTTLNAALDAGRLFATDYALLDDPRIQSQVRPGTTVAAPTCTFYLAPIGKLLPLAIRLRTPGTEGAPVRTCLDDPGAWLLARTHAQSADAHYHEAVYHLLETHMVSEIFAMAAARQLHPDHPVRQLLSPHFEMNLAINHLARRDLLSVGGPIDVVLAAGVGGALDLARAVWGDWSFAEHGFHADLQRRGLHDAPFEDYFYREDGGEIYAALQGYVERIVRLWYATDASVCEDWELAAFISEAHTHIPAGFPDKVSDRVTLSSLLTEIIFRASAGHSAVNNGQFDAYGFVPNTPGSVAAELPDGSPLDERDVMHALPGTDRCIAALGMAWTLSQPTHRSLLATGECPAFDKWLNPEAHAAVDALRTRLRGLSGSIQARNRSLDIPYTYLDPINVARSTDI